MDPNAALEEIQRLCRLADGGALNEEDGYRLAELVAGLDQWLSAGGFLPSAWAR